ncbi:MAG: ABC-F family ATP-binding cassette domain-containing protein [Erysipelotrichaceae bacterium]|nr:ABC-F family ATP-binding cassette domain-containing protein [Erysipelotrichaceae bacterium]
MILSLEDVSFKYAVEPILDHVNFVINEKDKWGVVGLNGSGKSTLLRIMAGVEKPDSGTVTFLKKYKISYCPQKMDFEAGRSVYETVRSYMNDETEVFQIKSILNKLGIINHEEKIEILSGGQQKRVALAIALIQKADLYLLDEPTNHLDQEMIVWLERFLDRMNKAVVLVTHDRYFLSRITNHIVDVENAHLYKYDGNYADYLEQREVRYQQALMAEHKRQRFLATEIEWIRAGAPARSTKQKGRIQRFEAIAAQEAMKEKDTLELKSASSRLGGNTIEMIGISKAFGDKVLFKDFSYNLLRSDRIGMIGPNGCGKSTFLKLLMHQMEPDSGEVKVGETVKIGYFAQQNDVFEKDMRVIDYLKEFGEVVYTAEREPITASQMLERFLFSKDDQWKYISRISGGEKRRLYLCSILMRAPNILLLDEPTNDLDTETLTILEEYLDHFKGAVMTVSHDRYFLDKVVDKLFVFESGNIQIVNGDYSSYLEHKEAQAKDTVTESIQRVQEKPKVVKLTYKEKKELEELEGRMEVLEKEISDLEEQLNSVSDFEVIRKVAVELEAKREEQELSILRWMELSEKA